MGKKTIETFIYDGISEWYLRIPLTKPSGIKHYDPKYSWTEYLPKDKFTIRQAIDRRLELLKEAEERGLRRKVPTATGFASRVKTSAFFEKQEADGLYDKYNKL